MLTLEMIWSILNNLLELSDPQNQLAYEMLLYHKQGVLMQHELFPSQVSISTPCRNLIKSFTSNSK